MGFLLTLSSQHLACFTDRRHFIFLFLAPDLPYSFPLSCLFILSLLFSSLLSFLFSCCVGFPTPPPDDWLYYSLPVFAAAVFKFFFLCAYQTLFHVPWKTSLEEVSQFDSRFFPVSIFFFLLFYDSPVTFGAPNLTFLCPIPRLFKHIFFAEVYMLAPLVSFHFWHRVRSLIIAIWENIELRVADVCVLAGRDASWMSWGVFHFPPSSPCAILTLFGQKGYILPPQMACL